MGRRTLKLIASKIQVTAYVDYRDYLEELYRQAKAAMSPYSYEAFASDLGFSAINSLRLVIVRQRQLADKSAQTVVKALDLRRENRKYFLAMVKHVNARSAKQKAIYFRKMLDAKQQSIVSHRDRDQLEFLSEWYHWVVLEMLRLDGVDPTPEALSGRMTQPVSAEKIRRSLALLDSLGLHAANASPTLALADETANDLAMTRHHQSMLDLAKVAIVDAPAEEREFNALTVNLSIESFKKLTGLIKTFCEDALALESRPQKRECVAQLNLNLFTLTKWKAGDS